MGKRVRGRKHRFVGTLLLRNIKGTVILIGKLDKLNEMLKELFRPKITARMFVNAQSEDRHSNQDFYIGETC